MGSSLTCQLPRGLNQDRFVPPKGRTEGWVIPISPYKYHQQQEGCSPRHCHPSACGGAQGRWLASWPWGWDQRCGL